MADKINVGRRKTAVARVILKNGNGKITVNDKEFEKFDKGGYEFFNLKGDLKRRENL